jgi:hypothetical protein
MSKSKVSAQTIDEALKIAKGTARPGQSKEQTKIIAQGIEKGIAEFKKREKAKARDRDRIRKKQQRDAAEESSVSLNTDAQTKSAVLIKWVPWVLLLVSWVGFLSYILMTQ